MIDGRSHAVLLSASHAVLITAVLGEPDHRDELLSSADRAAGAMLICVSRARSERLTLDL